MVGGVFCSRRRRGDRSLVGMENLGGNLEDPGVAVGSFFVSFLVYGWVMIFGVLAAMLILLSIDLIEWTRPRSMKNIKYLLMNSDLSSNKFFDAISIPCCTDLVSCCQKYLRFLPLKAPSAQQILPGVPQQTSMT